jgi:hypothetical protein
VKVFPEGQAFRDILIQVGFENVASFTVSGGIATIYSGTK